MDKSHNISADVESTPLEMEAPMHTHLIDAPAHDAQVRLSPAPCAHRRLIDDVRTKSGKATGKVRCLECEAIFDDPYRCVK